MLEDQLLLERALRGDKNSFAQIVEIYQTPVYNLAYRMLGNADDAEDAAQETFLRGYAQLKKFHADQKFATWLLSIDAHYCIDRLRRRRFLWLSLEDSSLSDVLVSDAPEVDDGLLRLERQQDIEHLLERLTPASRLVVVLHYWHDQSIEEIAKTTGESISAVKVKLYRARQVLAKALANPLPDANGPAASNASVVRLI